MDLFHLDSVSKAYGHTIALHPTTLTLTQGRSLGVIGESGSGKTTLTRLMLGLLEPTTGTVTYRGERVVPGKLGPTLLRREAQLVLQDPYASLNPRMRIGAIVAEPLRLLGWDGDRAQRTAEVLEQVGIDPSWSGRHPHELSGGQRQRVAIARAIAPRPRVLIADEPVSALDVSIRITILDLLQRLREQIGLTLVVVSHDLGIVQRLCEDTIVLVAGHVVESAPTSELLAAPRHPATRELLDAVWTLPSD